MLITFTKHQNTNNDDHLSDTLPVQQQLPHSSVSNKPDSVQSTSPSKPHPKNVNPYKPYPFGTHVMYKTHLFQNTGIINSYEPSTNKYSMKTKDGAVLQNLHRNIFTKLETLRYSL